MTKKEKRDNARNRMVQKLVDNILVLTGATDVVEGPRGNNLLELIRRETLAIVLSYETAQGLIDEC